jgi:uncharacterized membrane-anchored protein
MFTVTSSETSRDTIRQALNLGLALAQPVTTILCFALGTSFEEATRGNAAYATAIICALVGIVVANTIERAGNPPVAVAAGSMAMGVAAALIRARVAARSLALARG